MHSLTSRPLSPLHLLQDRRDAALARLAATKSTLTELQAELEAYGACDPVKVEQKRRAVVLAREAALRHTGKG